jgi:regulator of cell morphogenesis and NO signaling
MEYENEAVFTYVEQLLQGKLSDDYNITTFASKHNQIDTKLKELKNIIIKYYPEKGNNNLLNAALFDIFNCEQDLATHCQVEDYMFVPAVAQIERKLKDEQ